MVVSLRPIDDTRHVYVSGLRSGMTLDISVAKELGHALLKVASGSTPGVLGVSYRESGAD